MFDAIEEILDDHDTDDVFDTTLDPNQEIISTTLPVSAQDSYELFCSVDRIPVWLPAVRSVQVLDTDHNGRPQEAAFVASFKRSSLGYTLRYHYHEERRLVAWHTPGDTYAGVRGRASFIALSARATMMHYQLTIDLPKGAHFRDPGQDGHLASGILNDFRDFVIRSYSHH